MNIGDKVKITRWDEYVAWQTTQAQPSFRYVYSALKGLTGTLALIRDDGTASLRYKTYWVGTVPLEFLEVVSTHNVDSLKTKACPKCQVSSPRIGIYMGYSREYWQDGTFAVYHCPEHGNFEKYLDAHDQLMILESE